MDGGNSKPENRGLSLVSASGLDERQIAAEDIVALQALFVPIQAKLDLASPTCCLDFDGLGLDQPIEICEIALGVPEPRPLKIKVEPLPKLRQPKRLALTPPRLRIRRNLALALQQPIRRKKLRLGMLTADQQENMSRELFKKFGPAAKTLYLVAAFAQIPPESAKSISLDQHLRYATFIPAANKKNRPGYFLLILEGQNNKTEKVLVRL